MVNGLDIGILWYKYREYHYRGSSPLIYRILGVRDCPIDRLMVVAGFRSTCGPNAAA